MKKKRRTEFFQDVGSSAEGRGNSDTEKKHGCGGKGRRTKWERRSGLDMQKADDGVVAFAVLKGSDDERTTGEQNELPNGRGEGDRTP